MQLEISETSKMAFSAAAQKLNLSTTIPDLSILRPDLALWMTANYMMAVIIEADKDGKIFDATNHSNEKHFPWHRVKEGYVPGSGGGFSYYGSDYDFTLTRVGARLTFNSSNESRDNCEKHPDLWEIIKLNVK